MSETLALARALIARRSITPDDAGCQALIGDRLARAGFTCESLRFGAVDNLWAWHGSGEPLLVLAGHTDVVPPGPAHAWDSDPFVPVERDGWLYGRGAADMKGSLAAMVTAAERFTAAHRAHAGTLALLLTSDEEGAAVDGTARVVAELVRRRLRIRWCLVGEPTSDQRLGDAMRVGRRGSLTGELAVRGIQGHVAYPERARNPVHAAAPALQALCAARWDDGDADFPPTSFQISNVHAGTGADNVIPGQLDVVFNFRYSPALNADALQSRVQGLLDSHGLDYTLAWHRSGAPFVTRGGALIEALAAAARAQCGVDPARSTAGGTSDGRFIAPLGAEVAELGPVNATIHKVNERVRVADLETLSHVYGDVLERLLA